MRKGYVSERFMIVSKKDDKVVDPNKFPFAPGNESMTNPSVLSLVEKHGGVILAEAFPKSVPLSYPISKSEGVKNQTYESAYFGWIKFETQRESADNLKKVLQEHEQLLRSLLVKTVRESTLAPKRIPLREVERAAARSAPIIKKPIKKLKKPIISDEELDKTIEKLVAE